MNGYMGVIDIKKLIKYKLGLLIIMLLFTTAGCENSLKFADVSEQEGNSRLTEEEITSTKTIVYEGESQHWKGVYTIKHYEHYIKDETGRQEYDQQHNGTGDVWYKGEDADSVGEINIMCELGTASKGIDGFTLDEDKHVSMGTGGSNGALKIDDNATMTISWKGQEETFELQPTDEP